MKVTFDNVYNAFQIIAPKGTMISFTGEPTALADGVYLVGDDGIINLDEQFLTDTLYLSTAGTDYAVTGGMRVTYPLGDETVIIRAGSSAIPFSKGGKGGGSGSGTTKYKGTTTTPISNGSTTNPIVIDGEDYTAVFGDIVVYGYTEFVFDGTTWSEFGRPFDTTPTSGSANAVTSDGIYALIRSGTGSQSVCIGNTGNTATGLGSTAMGIGSRATARGAVAVGEYANATGQSSFATGFYSATTNSNQFSCGIYNKSRTGDLFNIGNGKSYVRSNIVEVNSTELNVNGDIKKNNVSLPTPYTTMPTITAAMLGQIAQYVGETTNDYVKGYFYIASSDGAAEPTYSWVSMVDDVPTSGSKNFVSSSGVAAVVRNGTGGSRSVILGASPSSTATSADCLAFGNACNATGNRSIALGDFAIASGSYSAAIGLRVASSQTCQFSCGKYNKTRTGDLFNIGNGVNGDNRSNILEANSTSVNVNGAITQNGTPVLVNAGTLPSLVYDSENEIFEFNPGTLPSGGVSS